MPLDDFTSPLLHFPNHNCGHDEHRNSGPRPSWRGHRSSDAPARRCCAHRNPGGRARRGPQRGPRRKAIAHPEGTPHLVLLSSSHLFPASQNQEPKLYFSPKSSTTTPLPSIINKHHSRGTITAAASTPLPDPSKRYNPRCPIPTMSGGN